MELETGELFITRKRKKWKFAHFDAWENCFQAAEATPKSLASYFGKKQPLVVEIGAGTADLSVGLATSRPGESFVAVDVKADRLYTGAKASLENDIENIVFVRAHADQLEAIFEKHSIKELWITFPDPFPRDRQAKHRLTHKKFLQTYRNLLTKTGELHFKTDNRELFLWSLEELVRADWQIKMLSFDLHESDMSANAKITTRYERKFIAEELPINYVVASPK